MVIIKRKTKEFWYILIIEVRLVFIIFHSRSNYSPLNSLLSYIIYYINYKEMGFSKQEGRVI